ncbi:Aminodeoxyfutalosine deaminase [Rubripirellula lacrimiformis]|uniref:Aminodeoxyfutalosine deaminase n=1 Tax=Rubripirellula lacrimiformis TaxID=1930273 RepID=A0A517NIN9_9BACT|nr:amidohydrolase family protein [Rubripirellula lacrimiformis]QDT06992.1 Aminodeoxyfutalosine deaminase [Rubripirellula lacrimiformis]
MSDTHRVITARWILPVDGEPIQGGWIRLDDHQIFEVQTSKPPTAAIDLGDVAVLPGLVNAHTHLEFSDLSQPIGEPGITLPQWISMVVRQRGDSDVDRRNRSIADGIQQSAAASVALIGDIATPPCHYDLLGSEESNPNAMPAIVSFAEVLGLSRPRSDARWKAAQDHLACDDGFGYSPHAPYSTPREMITRCVDASAKSGRPLAMHVAESPAERELLTAGTGPFADALAAMGVWNADLFPWDDRPLEWLIDELSRSSRGLLVHANDFGDREIQRIAQHSNLSVVYCPRTHAFFDYPPHPVDRLLQAGVLVALGTDSRASNPDLNLWGEVQHLLRHRTDLPPADVLRMATASGADALGRPDYGRIQPGCRSILGMLPTNAKSIDGVYESFRSEFPIPVPR